MKPVILRVIWTRIATVQLLNCYRKLHSQSIKAAEKVRAGIQDAVDKIATRPMKYPLDKYRKNNDGSVRAFEKYSYRVAYKVTSKEIIILRVRHVKQEPKSY